MESEQEVVYALSNGNIADNLEWLLFGMTHIAYTDKGQAISTQVLAFGRKKLHINGRGQSSDPFKILQRDHLWKGQHFKSGTEVDHGAFA